jgi:hypothetical protein
VETNKNRALTDFYREEFLKHLQCLDESGLVTAERRPAMDKARRRIVHDLDQVCGQTGFPEKAEALLRSFDALTRLSETRSVRGN